MGKNLFRHTQALTLIELMVVIAVVSLTISFAIPMYRTHVNKVHISQMVNKLSSFKLELVDTYSGTGAWPASINGATAPATISDTTFDDSVNFRYNTDDNIAWWGYQLSTDFGSGWIFMLLVANADGTFTTHCGSLSTSCTLGSCNSSAFYPAGCTETGLSTTYSLSDS